ncbi:Linear gramicidin synthase subunit D [Novipirellula aureliae]|uniref:Linear gramicidin synthase subunit D n=1 Tax=Novipirellula aureliae TaxID=2527966 RepID=A0A5C6D9U7_9BACT|nr:SDR family oxidoreductase [Novipirellula aureliae]TWU33640.1 Linear gramicidin synthase subunit D [Novipirellula aureliae]
MNRYFLITGASGLLGSFLMRDCLRQGLPIAVLVRKSRIESAKGRVESILAGWESRLGCILPRPIVLEGDICQKDLGLSDSAQQWVGKNCHSLVHSAASLSFELDEETNEPWRSNLEGTRNALEFARKVGIRKFHQVSTAYVCGLRTGKILESDVDVGQSLGNPYEESKLAAEKLVRTWEGIDTLTVHRPAIIVGDSQTGYTTTYHGFYTPLKVVHMLVGKVPASEMNVLFLLQALGLTGEERKNFVPVDWVSSVMTHILADESLHGRTYHLTPSNRVSINEMTAVLSDAIQKLSIPALEKASPDLLDSEGFEDIFRTQMETYQSYWRDDPEFGTANTLAAAPEIPCPVIDGEVMWRLAKFAVENNFGWPISRPVPAPLDVGTQLLQRARSDRPLINGYAMESPFCAVLEVSGPGGGEWTLQRQGPHLAELFDGRADESLPHAYLSSHTFRRLASGETKAADALRVGNLVVQGAGNSLDTVLDFVDHVAQQLPKSNPS